MKNPVRRNFEREAAARNRFLQKIIVFALSIAVERGHELPCNRKDFAFRKVWELDNFAGFSFNADTRQTESGGNSVKVWYQPNPRQGEASQPVLEVYWKDTLGKCEIRRLNPSTEWQVAIQNVMRRRVLISLRIDRERTRRLKELRQMPREHADHIAEIAKS